MIGILGPILVDASGLDETMTVKTDVSIAIDQERGGFTLNEAPAIIVPVTGWYMLHLEVAVGGRDEFDNDIDPPAEIAFGAQWEEAALSLQHGPGALSWADGAPPWAIGDASCLMYREAGDQLGGLVSITQLKLDAAIDHARVAVRVTAHRVR